MKQVALLMTVGVAVLALAVPAFGQDSVGDTYGGQGGNVLPTIDDGGDQGGTGGTAGEQQASQPASEVTVTNSGDSSLPFTGLDVTLLVLGGLALLGVGIGLRRFARPLA